MISELIHLLLSTAVGITFGLISGNYACSIIATLIGGFFVDVDHLIDYLISKKHKFSIDEFKSGQHFKQSQKAYLFFHSYELVIIVTILSAILNKIPLLALAISLLAHLVFDIIHNRTKWTAYIFLNRANQKFELKALGCKNE